MNRLMTLLIGTTALGLGACGTNSNDPTIANVATDNTYSSVDDPTTPTGSAQAFANAAASSDAFEIASSELALEKSQSASVRKFATDMVAAHRQSTEKLKAAASSSAAPVVPNPALTTDQQAKLEALRAENGRAFDSSYIAGQITAHEATLSTLREYSQNGEDATLRTFASNLVPIVTAHLNMARSLKP